MIISELSQVGLKTCGCGVVQLMMGPISIRVDKKIYGEFARLLFQHSQTELSTSKQKKEKIRLV